MTNKQYSVARRTAQRRISNIKKARLGNVPYFPTLAEIKNKGLDLSGEYRKVQRFLDDPYKSTVRGRRLRQKEAVRKRQAAKIKKEFNLPDQYKYVNVAKYWKIDLRSKKEIKMFIDYLDYRIAMKEEDIKYDTAIVMLQFEDLLDKYRTGDRRRNYAKDFKLFVEDQTKIEQAARMNLDDYSSVDVTGLLKNYLGR